MKERYILSFLSKVLFISKYLMLMLWRLFTLEKIKSPAFLRRKIVVRLKPPYKARPIPKKLEKKTRVFFFFSSFCQKVTLYRFKNSSFFKNSRKTRVTSKLEFVRLHEFFLEFFQVFYTGQRRQQKMDESHSKSPEEKN